jgi:hypothetical protein
LYCCSGILVFAAVHEFELRETESGLRLSGGQLEDGLNYPASDKQQAIGVVGFLSQRDGSILRLFDSADNVIETQRREATIFMKGAVGGLEGPR